MNVKYLDVINTAATNSLSPSFFGHTQLIFGGVYHVGLELLGHRVAINFLRNGAVGNTYDRLCIRLT